MQGRSYVDSETGKRRFFIRGVEVTEDAFSVVFPDRLFGPAEVDWDKRREILDEVDTILAGSEAIDAAAEGHRRKGRTWPLHSHAMGCHPSQVREMQEFFRSKGIEARYDEKSRLICTSQKDMNRKAEALNMFHGDYGPSKDFHNPERRAWQTKRH